MLSSILQDLRAFSTLIFFQAITLISTAQSYTPIQLRGFNHDVVAEGSGNSSLIKTSFEMDAIDPSNFVLFTKQFAKANNMPLGNGLPDNGVIGNRSLSFTLQSFSEKNALYLFRNQSGRLRLVQPKFYNQLAFLGLATEGSAELELTLKFTDSTMQTVKGVVFPDWFDGPQPFALGFGRVKRTNGSAGVPLYHEGSPINPRMYTVTIVPTAGKKLAYVLFRNVTIATEGWTNRAFIFAISGVSPIPIEEKKEIAPEPSVVQTDHLKKPADQPIVIPEKKPSEEEKKIPVGPVITVKGNVLDIKSNKPIQASLSFIGPQSTTLKSLESGNFQVQFQEIGEYSVRVEAAGYIGITERVSLVAENILNFKLTPIAVGASIKLNNILFEQSSPRLKDESFPELNQVVDFLTANPRVSIRLSGHTDNRGDKKMNLKLSNDRVAEVKKYLVAKGIDARRITGKGYGGARPIAFGNNEEAWKINRRVEFTITGI